MKHIGQKKTNCTLLVRDPADLKDVCRLFVRGSWQPQGSGVVLQYLILWTSSQELLQETKINTQHQRCQFIKTIISKDSHITAKLYPIRKGELTPKLVKF